MSVCTRCTLLTGWCWKQDVAAGEALPWAFAGSHSIGAGAAGSKEEGQAGCSEMVLSELHLDFSVLTWF